MQSGVLQSGFSGENSENGPSVVTFRHHESPTSVFTKAVKTIQAVGEAAGFSKEEIQHDIRDCQERYKDQMLGPSRRLSMTTQDPSEAAPEPKRRKFLDDFAGDQDDKARHEEVAIYLKKTCKTEIFLRSKSDPEATRLLLVKNEFQSKDGKIVTMYKRQTATAKSYKCQLESCKKLKAYTIDQQTQTMNGHNKSKDHLKGVIGLSPAPEGWEVVPWDKAGYKKLKQKHLLARDVEEGACLPRVVLHLHQIV